MMAMQQAIAAQADSCFLSYSRADEDFALRLANDLRSLGVEMWVDQLNIRPSEHWDRAIERAIRSCRSVIAILSPRSVASENVADEIRLAIDSEKPIIPVKVAACDLPLRLTRMRLIDATRGYDAAVRQCLAAIKDGATPSSQAAGADPWVIEVPETLAVAAERLASIIGPIAGILVDRAASQATSVEGFYDLLASHIPDEADREQFTAIIGQHKTRTADAEPPGVSETIVDGGSIGPAEIERIAEILTDYLGPIAPIVTKKEWQASRSVGDLLRRLASKLRNEGDRTDFLSRLEDQMRGLQRRSSAPVSSPVPL